MILSKVKKRLGMQTLVKYLSSMELGEYGTYRIFVLLF